jgi:hypothetical protein
MRVTSGPAFDERGRAEWRDDERLRAFPRRGPATGGAVFGREAELASGDAFLAAAAERFAVMDVEGEAGIGKTTVWREVVRRAERRGFRVLAARPAEAETKLALSAVADMLERVPA